MLIAGLIVALGATFVAFSASSNIQGQASATGRQTLSAVQLNLVVQRVALTDGLGDMDEISIVAQLVGDQEGIALDDTRVIAATDDGETEYFFSGGSEFSVDPSSRSGTFGITYIQTMPHHTQGELHAGELVDVRLRTHRPLRLRESIRLTFINPNLIGTTLHFSTPSSIGGHAVHLFP
jgi:archaellin